MVINSSQQYILNAYNMLNMLFTIVTNTEEKQAMVLALKNLSDLLRDKSIYVYYLTGSALFRSGEKKYDSIS